MIGLLIQGNIFEQDIRELLMSFYPGEIYAHEVKEGVDFYVERRRTRKHRLPALPCPWTAAIRLI